MSAPLHTWGNPYFVGRKLDVMRREFIFTFAVPELAIEALDPGESLPGKFFFCAPSPREGVCGAWRKFGRRSR